MKVYLEKETKNLTTRNFPDSVETIRKKWKIKEGKYLLFFLQLMKTIIKSFNLHEI
jgi:hypothetical protein